MTFKSPLSSDLNSTCLRVMDVLLAPRLASGFSAKISLLSKGDPGGDPSHAWDPLKGAHQGPLYTPVPPFTCSRTSRQQHFPSQVIQTPFSRGSFPPVSRQAVSSPSQPHVTVTFHKRVLFFRAAPWAYGGS